MNKKVISITQISILIFSIISFSFIVGDIKFVSAESKNLAILPDASDSSSSPTPTSVSNKLSSATKTGSETARTTYTTAIQTADKNFNDAIRKIPKKSDGSYDLSIEENKQIYDKALKTKNEAIDEAKNNFIKDPSVIDSTGSKSGDWLLEKGWFDTSGPANFFGHIADGLFWSMTIAAAIKFIGGFVDDEGIITDALSSASFGGK
jgi:hypothetical protein